MAALAPKLTAGGHGRRIPRWTAIAVVVIACLQVGVPAYVFVSADGLERFGWQMFAKRVSTMPTARIIDEQGRERAVDLPPLARARPEFDYSRVLPSHICDRHPRATAVTLVQKSPPRDWTTPC